MRNKFTKIVLIAGLVFFTGSAYAGAPMPAADEEMEPAHDPKKKKAGEECKSSGECQSHHACKEAGEKKVCTAPERPKLPPGVVT